MNKHVRRAIAAVSLVISALLLSAWTVSQHRTASRQDAYVDSDDKDLLAISKEFGEPLDPRRGMKLAYNMARDYFPVDYAAALSVAEGAILSDPLYSVTWNEVSRSQLYLGNSEEARAALARADELDPRFPVGRLLGVRLWYLLGEEERGKDLARRIAALGPDHRADVGVEMISSGYSVAEAFEIIKFNQLPLQWALWFLQKVKAEIPSFIPLVAQELDPSVLRNPEFRTGLATLAMAPPDYGLLAQLWKLEGAVEVSEESGLLIQNPDLRGAPFASTFPLGWQPSGDANVDRIVWRRPQSRQPGSIRIDLSGDGNRGLSYGVYRFLQPPQEAAVVSFRVAVETPEPGLIALELDDRTSARVVARTEVSTNGFGEVNIGLRLEPTLETRIVLARLIWRPRRESFGIRTQSPFLHIEEISISSDGRAGGSGE